MKAITVAMLACGVLAISGCGRHRNEDPNFYDNQWSKSGANEESWKQDEHECKVEEQQRMSYDALQVKNARDLDNDMYESSRRSGTVYWGGGATAVSAAAGERAKLYWRECMEARSWKLANRTVIGTEDNDISADTNSFKPDKTK